MNENRLKEVAYTYFGDAALGPIAWQSAPVISSDFANQLFPGTELIAIQQDDGAVLFYDQTGILLAVQDVDGSVIAYIDGAIHVYSAEEVVEVVKPAAPMSEAPSAPHDLAACEWPEQDVYVAAHPGLERFYDIEEGVCEEPAHEGVAEESRDPASQSCPEDDIYAGAALMCDPEFQSCPEESGVLAEEMFLCDPEIQSCPEEPTYHQARMRFAEGPPTSDPADETEVPNAVPGVEAGQPVREDEIGAPAQPADEPAMKREACTVLGEGAQDAPQTHAAATSQAPASADGAGGSSGAAAAMMAGREEGAEPIVWREAYPVSSEGVTAGEVHVVSAHIMPQHLVCGAGGIADGGKSAESAPTIVIVSGALRAMDNEEGAGIAASSPSVARRDGANSSEETEGHEDGGIARTAFQTDEGAGGAAISSCAASSADLSSEFFADAQRPFGAGNPERMTLGAIVLTPIEEDPQAIAWDAKGKGGMPHMPIMAAMMPVGRLGDGSRDVVEAAHHRGNPGDERDGQRDHRDQEFSYEYELSEPDEEGLEFPV